MFSAHKVSYGSVSFRIIKCDSGYLDIHVIDAALRKSFESICYGKGIRSVNDIVFSTLEFQNNTDQALVSVFWLPILYHHPIEHHWTAKVLRFNFHGIQESFIQYPKSSVCQTTRDLLKYGRTISQFVGFGLGGILTIANDAT